MLLMPNDIGNALEALLMEKFPGEEVHRELAPTGFSRPANLVVQDKVEGNADFGCGVVHLSATFTITTFVAVDEYHHSHLAALHLRQMAIAGLLMPGFIKVGNRFPKVEGFTLAGGYDYDTVTVTVSYTLDRADFMTLPQYELMGDLHMNEEVRTYG